MTARVPGSPGPPRRVLWDVGAVSACVALATVAATEIYATAYVAVVAAAALALSIAVVFIAAVRNWRWWTVVVAAFAGYIAVVVPATMPGAMTSGSRFFSALVDGLAGLVTGWKQLLTISVPAGTYQGVLVPFFVIILAGSLLALSVMTFRPARAGFAMAPMLLMVGFGAAFGSSSVYPTGIFAIPDGRRSGIAFGALVVCVVWSLGRARIDRSLAIGSARAATGTARLGAASLGFGLRRYGSATVIVAAVLAGTVVLAPIAASLGDRLVPRDSVDPVVYLNDQASPLAEYRRHFEQPAYETALFVLGGATSTDRLRIATLNDYDGQVYRIDGNTRFTRQPLVQGDDITITIAEGYRGAWVPLATANGGQPTFIGARAEELADAYYANVESDVGVIVAGQSGLGLQPGDSYTVSAAASREVGAIAAARGGQSRVEPDDYPLMNAWVERQGLGRTGADLVELVDRLRQRGFLSHASRTSSTSLGWTSALDARADYTFHGSRPGHSAARVDELFGAMLDQEQRAGEFADDAALVAAVGDDEQFATAASLLAGLLGFESRVAIGVRLGETGTELGVPPCVDVCTGAHVTAWTEVQAPDGSWIPLDVTPQFAQPPLIVEEGQTPPQNPTKPQEAQSEVVEPPAVANDATATQSEAADTDDHWLDRYLPIVIAVLVALGSLGVLVAPLLVFPVAKSSRRRWRRRHTSAEVSMVGAWEELVDTYVDLGLDVPRGLTRAETADVLGRPAAATIAATVDRAVFSEEAPTSQARDAAWRLLDAERRAVAKGTRLRRRLRARLTGSSVRRAARSRTRASTPTLLRRDRRDLR